jgi:cell pole-organizing protein PopZ
MSNPDKSGDRSMSDILASIRKIMATEPAGGAPATAKAPANGAPVSLRPDVVEKPREAAAEIKPVEKSAPTAASAPAAPSNEPVSLDDFLAMAAPQKVPAASAAATPKPKADASNEPVTVPAAAAAPASKPAPAPAPAAAAEPAIPSWLFPQQKQQPETSAAPAAKPASLDVPAPPAFGTAPAASRTVGPAPSFARAEAATPKAPAATPLGAPSGLGDLGSVVPGRFDPPASRPSDPPKSEPDRGPAAAGPALGPPLGSSFAGAPAGEPSRAAPEPTAEIPGADALRRLIAGVVPPSAHPSLAPPPKSTDEVPTEVAVPSAKALAAPVVAKAPEPASAAPAAAKPMPADVSKPIEKPMASATAVPAAAPAKPAAPVTTAAVVAPGPAARAPTPKPEATLVAKAVSESAPVMAGTRTMDETVVELLRPLLRDWLDKNMPRLIEPALKAELEALRAELDKEPKT